MAKLLGCRVCLVELARIELADGSIALMCSGCEVIGIEREVVRGGPMWAGEWSKNNVRSPRAAGR